MEITTEQATVVITVFIGILKTLTVKQGCLSYVCGRLKFFLRSVSGRLNVEFSFSSNLSDDFCFLIKLYKKSLTQ